MPLGGVWAVNTLAQINSDAAEITRKMILETMEFSQGEEQPTITALGFVEKNVYTINEKIRAQRPTGSLNDAFKFMG
jgi:prophage tail gpP-like protein